MDQGKGFYAHWDWSQWLLGFTVGLRYEKAVFVYIGPLALGYAW
jgi:hypothetical protein